MLRRRQHQGGATRLGWPGQVCDTLRGESDRRCKRGRRASPSGTGPRTRYTPVADDVWCEAGSPECKAVTGGELYIARGSAPPKVDELTYGSQAN